CLSDWLSRLRPAVDNETIDHISFPQVGAIHIIRVRASPNPGQPSPSQKTANPAIAPNPPGWPWTANRRSSRTGSSWRIGTRITERGAYSHSKLWPNGSGIGLRNRGLRVRVPAAFETT